MHTVLWQTTVAEYLDHVRALEETLSSEEKARAERFATRAQRTAFMIGRGLLRALLSGVIGRPAATFTLATEPQGKPFIADMPHVHINLSHSRGRLLYGIGPKPLGVDVECHDRPVDSEKLMRRISTEREWSVFQTLPSTQKAAGFFDCWTRKEAMLKAIGCGLAGGLDQVDVWGPPFEAFGNFCEAMGRRWWVQSVPTTAGWSAAFAIADVLPNVQWLQNHLPVIPAKAGIQ